MTPLRQRMIEDMQVRNRASGSWLGVVRVVLVGAAAAALFRVIGGHAPDVVKRVPENWLVTLYYLLSA